MRLLLLLAVALPVSTASAQSTTQPATAEAGSHASAFVRRYCVSCHGDTKPEAGLSLSLLTGEPRTPAELLVWRKVFEQLESGVMPPEDADQPSALDRLRMMERTRIVLRSAGAPVDETKARASERGNWIDHATLFAGGIGGDAATPDRVWRVTDDAYAAFFKGLTKSAGKLGTITPPWQLPTQWSFPDYSTAHRVGEPEIEVHLRSSQRVAKHIISLIQKDKSLAPFAIILQEGKAATAEQRTQAAAFAFERLLSRRPEVEELDRYAKFLTASVQRSGGERGLEQLLIVLLSRPSVFYRIEKPADGVLRGLPPPQDLARSIALTLTDREPDTLLLAAAAEERLTTAADVRREAARILADDRIAKPRLVRFFREYFGYDSAPDVFKDEATQEAHGIRDWEPTFFVTDADRLVAHVLAADQDVLRRLLTTNQTFVLTYDDRKPTKRAHYFNHRFGSRPPERPIGEHGVRATLAIYEVVLATRGDWSPDRPYDMPPEHRLGLLTHPAWLVAQSGNFDNHAIHRGRWIRERLLGGNIPDVPITVNAMLPDEPHHTLRDRMQVVREEYCWNCHQRMDPLGLPFEQFDHFGRFRTTELVLDKEATESPDNRGKDGKPRQPIYKQVPLDTTGHIEGSLDPSLNGPVKDPFELIRKLAGSEFVEQVFVRHAFRFFLGRNETYADGPVLVAAQGAYRKSGGSMRALLTSLLTSDSFLNRSHVADESAVRLAPATSTKTEPIR